MNVILLEKVRNLGQLGETVRVRPGYGRNFLIPQGKAVPATEENVRLFEERRAELERKAQAAVDAAKARAGKLEGVVLTLVRQAGDEGKLFGSVGSHDIVDALVAMEIEVDRKEIDMPEGPIRNTGEFEVVINLHPEVEQSIQVVVTAG